MSWDQIYDSAADLPWTMAANGLQSNAWNDKHHFVKNIADENFSKIIIEDGFEISITKADQSSVSIEGNKEIIERLDTKYLTGTLHIGSNGNDDWATPAVEMDRLLRLLDRTAASESAAPTRVARLADHPDATVIRIEDD